LLPINDIKSIEKALNKIGFRRKGRYFTRDDCPYLIDFVNPPIAVGNEPIHRFETINIPGGSLKLLTPTDCVKDRLASFFHWNDQQGLEQAILVAMDHNIDLNDIKRWAKAEGHQEKCMVFSKKLQAQRKGETQSPQ
jgi:hypothetical protein